MSRLDTTITIVRYSLKILRRQPRLLAFPVISLLAFALIVVFLLAPVLLDISTAQIWQAIISADARDEMFGAMAQDPQSRPDPLGKGSFGAFLAYHLVSMFILNVINVAFYSQIIEAMNGNRPSVSKGFVLCLRKLAEITAWSLVAGFVSALLGALQEGPAPLIALAGLVGVAWTAASLFVIPVIINEPLARRPLHYVRISLALLKRVWAESLLGFLGLCILAIVLMFVMAVTNIGLMASGGSAMSLMPFFFVTNLGIFALLYLTFQIFQCGLYVYATQGVPPGSFDDDTFERAWTVKDPQQLASANGEPGTPGRAPRRRIWPYATAITAVLGASLTWLVISLSRMSPDPPPPQPEIPTIGMIGINLAELGYAFRLEDAQAIGLFPGKTCEKCDFSATGTWVLVGFKRDDGLRVRLSRQRDLAYIFVRGTDEAAGQQLVTRIIEDLRSRFPGHEAAIERVEQIQYIPRTTLAKWDSIAGAKSYTIEIDCYHCCGDNKWCTEVGSKWKIVRDLRTTSYTFDWVGAQPGRWRVWSVDASGKRSEKSGWTNFDYSM